ncbi:T9SS type A sorting domain-containing protein [Hymenobacter koreensis]|uniref:Secretion system C-terminal sorting domain-containing protein n=1 Tax=Hymenobacter koreensis TaxID=1084523 RepID=A0ABP8IXU0_9BACT
MKQTYSWNRIANLFLQVAAASVIAACGNANPPKLETAEERPDQPDLAMEQDAELTRDPNTGTVPRERLLAAYQFNEEYVARQAQQRATTGSLAYAVWTERGPSNVAGRLRTLMVDPNDATGNTVWAGAAGGGLWKITNATAANFQWTNVNRFFSTLAVSSLAYTPGTSPTVMYAGTGEGFFNVDAIRGMGIWKSADGGNSWAQLASTNNANFEYVQKVMVHPTTKNVYAATRGSGLGGVYRSTDAGASWVRVLPVSRVADIEIAADGTVYASSGLFTTDGIYRSASGDAGSWTKLNDIATSGLPTTGFTRIELACAPSDANRVYALFAGTNNALLNIYRSMDGGATWQTLPRPVDADPGVGTDFTRGQAWYDLTAAVSPTDPNTLFVGGIDIFKTSNAGAATASTVSWQQVTHWYGGFTFQNVHADQHAIVFQPGSGSKAYFGNDGGFFSTTTAGNTIPALTNRNNGLNVTQFYAVTAHPTNYNFFLAGAQDNGTQRLSTAGLGASVEVTGGDGGFCAIDQDNGNIQFSSYVYNQYRRTSNSWTSYTTFNLTTNGSFINPFDYDSRANILYAAHNTDTYLAWTNATTATSVANAATINPSLGAGAGRVTHVTVSPLTDNRIYVGTNAGKVYRVDNAHTTTPTVTLIRTGTAGTSVSCVAIDPATESHLLVTYSNYGITNVLETTNGGTTWTALDGNLPDMPVRWALFDPRNTTRALLATEMGVYSTDAFSGATTDWQPSLYATMNTRVSMLRYRPGDKAVVAASHGRGVFTSNIFALTRLPLPVELVKFGARATEAGVALNWQTATEQNTRSFEIERAAAGKPFAKIGAVAAAGESANRLDYSYLDATAAPGSYTYRLRMLDNDGTFTYSTVANATVVSSTAPLLVGAYPVPFDRSFTVKLRQVPAEAVRISLTDMQGRTVFTTQASGQLELPVRVPTLASGSYVLTVRTTDGRTSSQRVTRR